MNTGFLINLLYPPKCVICGRIQYGGEECICETCLSQLPRTNPHYKRTGPFYSFCLVPLWYKGDFRQSFLRYKFGGKRVYAPVYSAILCERLDAADIMETIDYITWAPLVPRRLRKRGYDQAALLAQGIARHYGIPAIHLLKKKRGVGPQTKTTSLSERRANISGAYRMRSEIDLHGKRILLVDDVITTGSTLSECAKTLKTAGAAEIVCIALATPESDLG